jgi:hypothetical protein
MTTLPTHYRSHASGFFRMTGGHGSESAAVMPSVAMSRTPVAASASGRPVRGEGLPASVYVASPAIRVAMPEHLSGQKQNFPRTFQNLVSRKQILVSC